MKFESKYKSYHSSKCILKCRLRNGGYVFTGGDDLSNKWSNHGGCECNRLFLSHNKIRHTVNCWYNLWYNGKWYKTNRTEVVRYSHYRMEHEVNTLYSNELCTHYAPYPPGMFLVHLIQCWLTSSGQSVWCQWSNLTVLYQYRLIPGLQQILGKRGITGSLNVELFNGNDEEGRSFYPETKHNGQLKLPNQSMLTHWGRDRGPPFHIHFRTHFRQYRDMLHQYCMSETGTTSMNININFTEVCSQWSN